MGASEAQAGENIVQEIHRLREENENMRLTIKMLRKVARLVGGLPITSVSDELLAAWLALDDEDRR